MNFLRFNADFKPTGQMTCWIAVLADIVSPTNTQAKERQIRAQLIREPKKEISNKFPAN
jgi:hypothetical protein